MVRRLALWITRRTTVERTTVEIPDDLLPEIHSVSRQLAQTLETLQQFERRLNTLAELTKGDTPGEQPTIK